MNTYIWIKAKYTKTGVKELVRIIYNPQKRPAKEIVKDWILPELQYQCYGVNKKSQKQRRKGMKKYILLFCFWLTGVAFGYWWCWEALTG